MIRLDLVGFDGCRKGPPERSFFHYCCAGLAVAVVVVCCCVCYWVAAAGVSDWPSCSMAAIGWGTVSGVSASCISVSDRAGMAVRVSSRVASGDVVSSASAVEAMGSPSVTVAPVMPGAYAEEDSVKEVAGAVEAGRSAGVGGVVEVSVGADGRRSADDDGGSADGDGDLGLALWRDGQGSEQGRGTEQKL